MAARPCTATARPSGQPDRPASHERLPTPPAVVGLGFGLTALAGPVLAYAATVAVWTLGEIITAGLGAAIVAGLLVLAPAIRRRSAARQPAC